VIAGFELNRGVWSSFVRDLIGEGGPDLYRAAFVRFKLGDPACSIASLRLLGVLASLCGDFFSVVRGV
jgi:hypothetical protein